MKTLCKSLLLASAILMSSLGHAQLGGLGGLKDAMGGGDSSGGGNALQLQGELILGMSVAMASFLKADAKFMDAIGLKKEANKLRKLGDQEPSENDKNLDVKFKASAEASEKMDEFMSSGKELTAEGKKDLADGMLPYIAGLASMGKMAKIAPDFIKASADEIKSVRNPMQVIKIKKQFDLGIKTGKEVPKLFKKLGSSSKNLFAFAKKNKVNTKELQKRAEEQGVDPGITGGW